uniref:C2H2-type domain-containing protein n=1 Tax=Panagrellus redivivus TaxID=6233 RepID=A0A7E4V1D1_PANRE
MNADMDYENAENVNPLRFVSPEPFADVENHDDLEFVDARGDSKSDARRKTVLGSTASNLIAREHFQCGMCFKTLTTRQGLKNHLLRTHNDVRSIMCRDCGQTFKSHSNLADHRKHMHDNVKFTCVLCQKSANYRSNLKKHLSKHCSTKEELEALWEEHYSTDKTKQISAARKRKSVDVEQVDVSIVTDASKLDVHPPPRSQRMQLGNFFTRFLSQYHNNMLYPTTPFAKLENMFHTDATGKTVFTPSFMNHECPLCPSLMLPRTRLLEHMDMQHDRNIVAEHFCRICLKSTRNINLHKELHVDMEKASQAVLSVTKNCLEPLMDRPLFDEAAEIEKDRLNVM